MKITFLGTGTSQGVPIVGCTCEICRSSDPRDNRLRTSAFIEVNGVNLLIDAGPDLRQQLLNNNITKVDAILVTHEHKDHVGGIDDIRPINFLMKKTMNIYGLQRTLAVIRKDYDYAFKEFKYPGVPNLQLHSVKDDPFEIAGITIIPIHVQHLNMPILGYRIDNFAYITDASFIADKEKSKLQGLDMLVINALRREPHYSHFNLEQALSVINELKPKKAFFTHISHHLGKYTDLCRELPSNIQPAYDGESIII